MHPSAAASGILVVGLLVVGLGVVVVILIISRRQEQKYICAQDNSDDADVKGTYPSLDVAFGLVHDALADQRQHVDTLDGKANFVLTASTIVLGAGLTAQVAITPHMILLFGYAISRALLVAALVVAYLIVVFVAYQAYKLRSYEVAPDPRILAVHYLDAEVQETKITATRQMAQAFANSRPKIEDKGQWTQWALWALMAESLVLAAVLVLETMS